METEHGADSEAPADERAGTDRLPLNHRATSRLYSLKVSQLLFTYLLPLGPILIFWDGLVSCLRTYFAADLELMTDIGKTGVVKLPKGGGAFPWLTGRPL